MQFERRAPPHASPPLPKERDPSLADSMNSLDGLALDCEIFSLSLRERAGVRGEWRVQLQPAPRPDNRTATRARFIIVFEVNLTSTATNLSLMQQAFSLDARIRGT
jgi:hypothetical protein